MKIKIPRISKTGKIIIQNLPESMNARNLTAFIHKSIERKYPEWVVEYGTSLETLNIKKSFLKAIRLHFDEDSSGKTGEVSLVATTRYPTWPIWIARIFALYLIAQWLTPNEEMPYLSTLFFFRSLWMISAFYIFAEGLNLWLRVFSSIHIRTFEKEVANLIINEMKEKEGATSSYQAPRFLRVIEGDIFILDKH